MKRSLFEFTARLFLLAAFALPVLFAAVPAAAQGDFFIIPAVSMTFRGDWDPNTSYNARDVVFYNGSSWFSLLGPNKGNAPSDVSTGWTMLARKGDKGDQGPVNPDADTVDGKHAADFALSSHAHGGADITTGMVAASRIDPAIARKQVVDAQISALADALASLQAAVDARESTIASLESTVNAQQATITELTTRLEGTSRDGDTLLLRGMNLQIVSGSGLTNGTVNGKGNLIIGYNELRTETGAVNDRGGSHNLVVGSKNNYSSYGGMVVGGRNAISGKFASVSGGYGNTASGNNASVSGGLDNTAAQSYASVSGGHDNTASGEAASVSGGNYNAAEGHYASVSGGYGNTSSGTDASVSGGSGLVASGTYEWRAPGH